MTKSVLVLGLDPGLAKMGVVLIELTTDQVILRKAAVIRTEKSDKKVKVLATEDNLRRSCEIYRTLKTFASVGNRYAQVICTESMSWPRSAGAAAKVALAWGTVAALAVELDVPVVQVSPMELKNRITGVKTATKRQVEGILRARFGADVAATGIDRHYRDGGVASTLQEHIWDAAGAVIASLDGEVLRMARSML